MIVLRHEVVRAPVPVSGVFRFAGGATVRCATASIEFVRNVADPVPFPRIRLFRFLPT